jgi:hypothetical protein
MSAGALWRGRLMRAFATLHIGASFGSDLLPSGGFTAYGFQQYMPGRRAMNDPHRLFAYKAEPEDPLFIVTNPVDAFVSSPHERLEEAMMSAVDVGGLTSENQIAYDLYANSFGQGYEPRFALLMIAVECMIEPKLRSEACRAYIESMISATRTSGLPERETDSLVGSLRYMLKQSISQAGQDIARQLEPNQYDDKDAVRFFKDCYAIRSRLVHGIHPLPTPEDLLVRSRVGAVRCRPA